MKHLIILDSSAHVSDAERQTAYYFLLAVKKKNPDVVLACGGGQLVEVGTLGQLSDSAIRVHCYLTWQLTPSAITDFVSRYLDNYGYCTVVTNEKFVMPKEYGDKLLRVASSKSVVLAALVNERTSETCNYAHAVIKHGGFAVEFAAGYLRVGIWHTVKITTARLLVVLGRLFRVCRMTKAALWLFDLAEFCLR